MGIKKCKSIIKKKKKHNKIVLLAKSKLNRIEVLTYKNLIDLNISHGEFILIKEYNVFKEYNEMKEETNHASDLRPLVVILKVKIFQNKELAEQLHKPVIR